MKAPQYLGTREHRAQDPTPVCSHHLLHLELSHPPPAQVAGELRQFSDIFQSRHRLIETVEIAAQTDALCPTDFGDVLDMTQHVVDGSPARFDKERRVEIDADDPAGVGYRPYLIVGEISRVIAEGACVGVRCDDGAAADADEIPKTPPRKDGRRRRPSRSPASP